VKNRLVTPFLKWVGGKRQLINELTNYLPKGINSYEYIEPFVGGGALFFHLQSKKATINDLNSELINVYLMIKNNLEELISELIKHKNTSEYFYSIRSLDRDYSFHDLSNVFKASRVIYLNKTCFNGLYRVNNSGEFNSPFGNYKNPNIINEPTLRAVNKYLNENDIKIFSLDYEKILTNLNEKSFVYLDPPYHPISNGNNFTGYVQGGWTVKDQIRLKINCDKLKQNGIKFMLSNSSSEFIIDLYKEYNIKRIMANRLVNSDASKRGEVEELIIRNYE